MKKERPILFSTAMVQALLAGRKTQTRRIIKEAKGWDHNWKVVPIKEEHIDGIHRYEMRCGSQYSTSVFKCPYGQIEDTLWVKESFWEYGRWVETDNPKMKNRKEWHPLSSEPIRYAANNPKIEPAKGLEWSMGYRWRKMSSLFLKREHARIWMEETDLRAERVQYISEEDAKAEGVEQYEHGTKWLNYMAQKASVTQFIYNRDTAIASFESLWELINGRESLLANPWVWAISFKVLSTTGRPGEK